MKQAISQSEWEIMRVVWTYKAVTNNDIYDVLAEDMQWKMSTIKTLVRRLTQKGYLEAKKDSREYVFVPKVTQKEAVADAGDEFLDHVCNTKVGSVLTSLVDKYELSQSDLAELEDLIQEKKKTAPETVACRCIEGQCECHIAS